MDGEGNVAEGPNMNLCALLVRVRARCRPARLPAPLWLPLDRAAPQRWLHPRLQREVRPSHNAAAPPLPYLLLFSMPAGRRHRGGASL